MKPSQLFATALVGAAFLTGCSAKDEAPVVENPTTETPVVETPVAEEVFTGVATIETPYGEDSADVVITSITYEDGKPVDLSIDVRLEDGTLKSELSANGEYVMSEEEGAIAWHEQVASLVTFIKDNDFNMGLVTLSDEAGHTDAVSGVSIKINAYLPGVITLLDQVEKGTYVPAVETDIEIDVEAEADALVDVDADVDAEAESEADVDVEVDADAETDVEETPEA